MFLTTNRGELSFAYTPFAYEEADHVTPPRYGEARKQLYRWLEEGKLQRKETIIRGGLPKAAQALADLYKGVNTGEPLKRIRIFY